MEVLQQMIEKVQTPASRAGHTAERVAKMVRAGVAAEAIAAQLRVGSAKGHRYTTRDVETLAALFADCTVRTPLPARQAKALIADATHARDADFAVAG